ncbi:MAG TPA: GNAT family protein [Leptolinea sp.]
MQLIPFSQKHFGILPAWFADEAAIVQWGGPQLHFPLDAYQMQAMLDEGATYPPRRLCWMAEQNGQWAGHVQLAFDWRNGNATLGRMVINPELRGQGFAVPMLRLVMAQAFAYSQIIRLELNVYTFNLPAIHTYARLRFVHEGIRRSSVQMGSDRWDTAMMAILRSEYLVSGLS